MFMGNEEIKNTLALTKRKYNTSKIYMLRFIVIISFIFIILLLPNIIATFKSIDMVSAIKLIDFSYFIFIGTIIAVIIMCHSYKQTNDYYSIFPQTNTSRFVSSQIILYLWMLFLSIISLILYLLQVLVYKILSLYNTNIKMAYTFDFEYTLVGFLIYFMYGIFMISLISLIAALIRKFSTIAVVSLLIIAAILITSHLTITEYIPYIFGFIIQEAHIGIFFIKGFTLCFLLAIASFLINRDTIYYKTHKKRNHTIIITLGIVVIIIVNIFRISMSADEPAARSELLGHDTINNARIFKNITLDASDYEDLGMISVITNIENIENSNIENSNINMIYNHINHNNLKNAKGKNIVISYLYPVNITSNINLTDKTNPALTATLEDNVLTITYTYDKNIKVVFIPPWSIMKQFEKYKNKGIHSDMPYYYSYSSGGSGQVFINVQ